MAMVPSGGEKTCLTLETSAERLFPGIPDEVIMDQITPKLSWKDLVSLSLVSRGWRHAFRSRQVYNARVRSNSTDTFVVLNFFHSDNNSIVIVLYSTIENSCYNITIPNLDGGRIPQKCECLILDAKMYVLGGWGVANYEHDTMGAGICKEEGLKGTIGSRAVHVFDLAGLGQWRKCAEMRNGRAQFACGVLNGKIYVFGGLDGENPVFGSEVYDPNNDTWSLSQLMQYMRFEHRVAALGEEFVLHGGKGAPTLYYTVWQDFLSFNDEASADFYHPGEDEWRSVDQWTVKGIRFTAKGKFYSLLPKSIHVYDVANNVWRKLYTFGAAIGPRRSGVVEPLCVTVLDGELLAMVGWCSRGGSDLLRRESALSCLCRSKGFGTDNPKIMWQRVSGLRSRDCPVDNTRYLMSPIQL